MIYEYPSSDAALRQGDIFRSLPRIIYDPSKLAIVSSSDPNRFETNVDWSKKSGESSITALVRIEPVFGIVITQDCDADRTSDISFFRIEKFTDVTGLTLPEKESRLLKWWTEAITRKSRGEDGKKWFYLPQSMAIGFENRMAVNFQNMFQVDRVFLETHLATLRIGRLNEVADEHFREKIAQYFRRYPYNEWYPLSKEEFDYYTETDPTRNDTPPYPWQTSDASDVE